MDAINAGDTAWILIATALVMMMTPALAFFYGGMVRKKNLLSTINLSLQLLAEEANQQWTARFNPRPVTEADILRVYQAAW